MHIILFVVVYITSHKSFFVTLVMVEPTNERKNLEEIAQMVVNGANMETSNKANPALFKRYKGGLQKLALTFAKERDWEMEVLVYHGGVETTRKVLNDNLSAYWKPSGKWWTAYDQQECVIWDNFQDDVSIGELKRICDKYPYTVEIKKGTVNFGSKRIIFISNIPFDEWYPNALEHDKVGLRRRITQIVPFTHY